LNDQCLDKRKLVGLATDGASAMVGNDIGVVSLMRNDILNLIGVHCIAHWKALVIADVSKYFPELMFVQKIANKATHQRGH
jgi:hypothetical protein